MQLGHIPYYTVYHGVEPPTYQATVVGQGAPGRGASGIRPYIPYGICSSRTNLMPYQVPLTDIAPLNH